jgi:thioesterase domain-containing protein/acyl carrier protein
VLFTSGSTGRPKGVEVGHPSLTNFLLSMRERPGLDAGDRVLALTTIAFDIAALELFLPLVVGGTVDLVDAETAHDARRLRARLEGAPISFMQATPATWRMLVDAGWRGSPRLRIVCGGEALPPDLAQQLLARGSEVWNAYGPTETTVWSTLHRVTAASAAGASVPIGRPIDNTTAYVLGADRAPVPIGVEGELCLGGAGVSRGYRGRPELTRERFVDDPFAGRPGARLYRTGDIASFSDDGRLHCHGRTDRQIKLRGFRVEPGEVEAALGAVPGVRQVLVVAHGDADSGGLCAYWTGEADQDALFARACAALPAYMVPSAWVPLPAFPLTTSGKVDHRALPAAVAQAPEDGQPPRDPIEEQIATIWARVLDLPSVPVDRDFFALGGTSMKVLETRALVEQAFGVELPIAPFFEAPATVAALASRLAHVGRSSLRLLVEGQGEESPLFLIHAADGTLLPYANLARRLGGERSVYGLQPQGVEGLPMVHTRVEEMAAHYVAAIRSVQPQGPYLIGGLCVGAVIACEMARLLENEQEEVRLALFDAAEPSAAPKPHRRLKGRVDRVKAAVRESRLRNLPVVLVRKLRGFGRFEWERRTDRLRGRLAMAAIRVCRGRGLPLPRWARSVPMTTVCTLAAEHYRARHVVRDEIVLFRATSGEGQDEPVTEVYADPTLGWADRSAKGVRGIDVPGGHLSMLQEPYVAVLAERLSASLGSAGRGRRAG